MSETNTATPLDAAIALITERARELDVKILEHQRAIDVATASRSELLDLIATLSRKPRPRKPRPVTEAATGPAEDAPRPTVFATVQPPANDEAGDVAGEAA
jgi:hypothetical protein